METRREDPPRPERARWLTYLRAHWLALGAGLVYAALWADSLRPAPPLPAAYSAAAGEVRAYGILGQLFLAGLFALILLGNAAFRRRHRAFYLVMFALVILPLMVLYFHVS